eukprot:7042566-Karenia_brevis.AAC.1
MKVASLSLAELIDSDPTALNLFLPKGSRKAKCLQTQVMATYVRVLESLADLNDSLDQLDHSKFMDMEGTAVVALVPADPTSQQGKTKSKRTKMSRIDAIPLPDIGGQMQDSGLTSANDPPISSTTS